MKGRTLYPQDEGGEEERKGMCVHLQDKREAVWNEAGDAGRSSVGMKQQAGKPGKVTRALLAGCMGQIWTMQPGGAARGWMGNWCFKSVIWPPLPCPTCIFIGKAKTTMTPYGSCALFQPGNLNLAAASRGTPELLTDVEACTCSKLKKNEKS